LLRLVLVRACGLFQFHRQFFDKNILKLLRLSQIAAAAEEVRKKFGKVDLLINCAGILHPTGSCGNSHFRFRQDFENFENYAKVSLSTYQLCQIFRGIPSIPSGKYKPNGHKIYQMAK
jgi:NAD(P)-dependent dehydrogenase (short-subunit alcohol dehydrogenase family)